MIEKQYDNFKIITPKELTFDPIANANTAHFSSNPRGDWVGVLAALKLHLDEFPNEEQYKILEVGTAHGGFIKSFHNYMDFHKPWQVIGYGIDSKLHGYDPRYFDGHSLHFVDGKSTDQSVIDQFKENDFNFVFIDGCHCYRHTLVDAQNYYKKVKVGGLIGFHDISPTFQGGSEQPYTPECSEDRHIGCRQAIDDFKFEENGFEFVLEEYHTNPELFYGGVRLYRKVK
jgi:cephalosporin hydroxylase